MNVVRELREQAGLTQELLARLSGVERSMISRYETGVTSPRMDILYRLAEAVNLEIVVALRPASLSEPVERADPNTRAVPLSTTSSDLHTGGQGGGAVFTTRGDEVGF